VCVINSRAEHIMLYPGTRWIRDTRRAARMALYDQARAAKWGPVFARRVRIWSMAWWMGVEG